MSTITATDTACKTCILVANGFSNDELGLDDDHSTPAVHFRLEYVDDSDEFFGTCDYCREPASVYAVHEYEYMGA